MKDSVQPPGLGAEI